MSENNNQDPAALIEEIRGSWSEVAAMPGAVGQLRQEVGDIRRRLALERSGGVRLPGQVSEGCARALAAQFILLAAGAGRLEAVSESSATRDALLNQSRQAFNLDVRTAISTNDMPLPIGYGDEVRGLISEFGVCRKVMTRYPIGRGTVRPVRMGTRPTFGSIAMSAAMSEKSPTYALASLEGHKIGGIVRLPREIDENSMVDIGQFLARYGAIEFARAEDNFGFNADGGTTYESISGVVNVARTAGNIVTMDAGKAARSEATLTNFRDLRTKVNKAVLSGNQGAYYIDSTWEPFLRAFNTEAEPFVFLRNPDGSATLDGYKIVWTDVLPAYSATDAADTVVCVFGALRYWWFGEHRQPRIDTSSQVWFANDQLAVRFIEEIDFDYMAVDAAAALITGSAS